MAKKKTTKEIKSTLRGDLKREPPIKASDLLSTGSSLLRRATYTRHGQTKTPEYTAWADMKRRCYGKHRFSHLYRKRGIKVCERWRYNFLHFLADMGRRPSAEHSLDRIDNNGDYEPGNCRWATRLQQMNNQRRNRYITAFGRTHTVSEWGRIVGLTPQAIGGRLKRGWDVEKALSFGATRSVVCEKEYNP